MGPTDIDGREILSHIGYSGVLNLAFFNVETLKQAYQIIDVHVMFWFSIWVFDI